MTTDPLLFELPNDLRTEAKAISEAFGVPLERLVDFYRRGYNVKLGETGEHPFGKLDPSDQGELTVAFGVDRRQGVIRMLFGKPVGWLALPAGHARHLAVLLVEKADELDKSVS